MKESTKKTEETKGLLERMIGKEEMVRQAVDMKKQKACSKIKRRFRYRSV